MRDNTLAVYYFIVGSSILIIVMMGYLRPYSSIKDNNVRIASEYMILILFAHLLYQTDAVDMVDARSIAGWSLVFFISAQILVNCSSIFYHDLKNLYTRLRLCKIKRNNMNKWKLDKLVQEKN